MRYRAGKSMLLQGRWLRDDLLTQSGKQRPLSACLPWRFAWRRRRQKQQQQLPAALFVLYAAQARMRP